MDLGRNAEALQDLRSLCLDAVAVVAQDDVLELGVALGVERLLGPAEDLFLLGHGAPESLVAHEHDVEDGLGVLEKLVLPQNPELETLRDRDVPSLGSSSPARIFISVDLPEPLAPTRP